MLHGDGGKHSVGVVHGAAVEVHHLLSEQVLVGAQFLANLDLVVSEEGKFLFCHNGTLPVSVA